MNEDREFGAERWAILRMASSRTLLVAASLRAAGIDAWTPAIVLKRRRPRSKETIEIDAPLLPSFVFVAADQLPAIYSALARPVSQHPPFSLFRHAGRVPLLFERQVASLRAAEARAAEAHAVAKERERLAAIKASRPPVPPAGTQVKVGVMAFSGMVGTVEARKGGAAVVSFGSGIAFTIEAWHLESIAADPLAA